MYDGREGGWGSEYVFGRSWWGDRGSFTIPTEIIEKFIHMCRERDLFHGHGCQEKKGGEGSRVIGGGEEGTEGEEKSPGHLLDGPPHLTCLRTRGLCQISTSSVPIHPVTDTGQLCFFPLFVGFLFEVFFFTLLGQSSLVIREGERQLLVAVSRNAVSYNHY